MFGQQLLDAEGKLTVRSSLQGAIWNDMLERAPFAWSMRQQLQQILPMLFAFVSVMLPQPSLQIFLYIHVLMCWDLLVSFTCSGESNVSLSETPIP